MNGDVIGNKNGAISAPGCSAKIDLFGMSATDESTIISSEQDLLNPQIQLTSEHLCNKIRKTKRQRGDCLIDLDNPIPGSYFELDGSMKLGMFNANYIKSASTIASKTTKMYWEDVANSKSEESPTKRRFSNGYYGVNSFNSEVPLIQLASQLQGGRVSISNAMSNIQSRVLSSGNEEGHLTVEAIRRYAQPIRLENNELNMPQLEESLAAFASPPLSDTQALNDNKNISKYNDKKSTKQTKKNKYNKFDTLYDSGEYDEDIGLIDYDDGSFGTDDDNISSKQVRQPVFRAPDIELNTREIAWGEIAKDFILLKTENEEDNDPLSRSYASNVSLALSEGTGTSASRKRKYLNNQGSSKDVAIKATGGSTEQLKNLQLYCRPISQPNSSTNAASSNGGFTFDNVEGNSLAASMQIHAPVYKVFNQDNQYSSTNDDDEEEDISDDAVLARHEEVLKGMRDKWSQIQQLKIEARREAIVSGRVLPGSAGGAVGAGRGRFTTDSGGWYGSGVVSAVTEMLGINGNSLDCGATAPPTSDPNALQIKKGTPGIQVKKRGRPPKQVKWNAKQIAQAQQYNQAPNNDNSTID